MFNLVDQPWITVLDRSGKPRRESLRTLFANAGNIRTLACGGAVNDIPVLRLLAAISMRARALDITVDEYFDQWHDRFELVDDTHPFLQSPALRLAVSQPANQLDPSRETARGLFSLGTEETLEPADAAVALLAHLAWDTAGIKPAAGGDPRARKGKLYPPAILATGYPGPRDTVIIEADNLADTIKENTIPASRDDRASWEEEPADFERIGFTPTGPVSLLTTPSRRILLHADGQGRIDSFQSTYGTIPDPEGVWLHDPNIIRRKGEHLPAGGSDRAYRRGFWTHPGWLTDPDMRPRVLDHATGPTRVRRTYAVYRNASIVTDMVDQRFTFHMEAAETTVRFLKACDRMVGAWSIFRSTLDHSLGDTHDRAADYMEECARLIAPTVEQACQIGPTEYAPAIGGMRRDLRHEATDLLHGLHHGRFDGRDDNPGSAEVVLLSMLKRIEHTWNDAPATAATGKQPTKTKHDAAPTPRSARQQANNTTSGKPGRRSRPITRSGGGLEERTFDSLPAATIWLQTEDGKPKAQSGAISVAARTPGRTAYGYTWRYAD